LPNLLIFGFGYTGQALARRLRARDWDVWAAVRSPASADAARAAGVTPIDSADRDALVAAPPMNAILVTAPPDDHGCPALAALVPAMARAGAFPDWIGYLSTTGVYGDRDGAWVDETAGLHPTGPRGAARVEAERGWLGLLRLGVPVHVFRLAGIYGPGRSAFDALRDGSARRIVKPGQVFSRIHVDDIARVLDGSIAKPDPGAVYNVCDDEPAPPQDVVAFAAGLLGVAPPPEIAYEVAAPTMSEMARSFYRDSKRVSNLRIRDGLGVRLEHPDYRSGLRAILAQERAGP
jgi:nucleoside-diphosphate-sugar epimerase